MSPEENKSAALKAYVEAQRQVELAQQALLKISPVAASSTQYQASVKLHAGIRQIISQVSGMRVS